MGLTSINWLTSRRSTLIMWKARPLRSSSHLLPNLISGQRVRCRNNTISVSFHSTPSMKEADVILRALHSGASIRSSRLLTMMTTKTMAVEQRSVKRIITMKIKLESLAKRRRVLEESRYHLSWWWTLKKNLLILAYWQSNPVHEAAWSLSFPTISYFYRSLSSY